jgi:hypothetical protein
VTRTILLLALVLLVAVLPGGARADAAVAASVTKWSLRIAPKAQTLSAKMSASTSPDESLVFLRSFTRTGRQGAAAISATRPSPARGRKLRALATQAFVSFGDSGALLIRAVQMVKAGQSEAEVTPTLNQAKGRANAGTTRLRKAAPLIAAIAR